MYMEGCKTRDWLRVVTLFFIRKVLRLKKNQLFRIEGQTEDCEYYFTSNLLLKAKYENKLLISKATISINDLLDNRHKIIKYNKNN